MALQQIERGERRAKSQSYVNDPPPERLYLGQSDAVTRTTKQQSRVTRWTRYEADGILWHMITSIGHLLLLRWHIFQLFRWWYIAYECTRCKSLICSYPSRSVDWWRDAQQIFFLCAEMRGERKSEGIRVNGITHQITQDREEDFISGAIGSKDLENCAN